MSGLSGENLKIATGRIETVEMQSAVARHLNLPQSTLSCLWGCLLQTNSTQNHLKSCRQRITTQVQNRYILVTHLRHRPNTVLETTQCITGLRRNFDEASRRCLCGYKYSTKEASNLPCFERPPLAQSPAMVS